MGTGVVFTGLVLTYLTIVLIIKLPLLAAKWKKEPVPVAVPQIPVPAGTDPVQISNEKMAVIATVLEVELRLRKNVGSTRFTFRK
jgi:hypothetical protein